MTHDKRIVFEGERTVLLKRRADLASAKHPPAPVSCAKEHHMSRPSRFRRSELSTPGTSEKMIAKAAQTSADLVFLDLEDAVAPAAKEAARATIVAGLAELDWGTRPGLPDQRRSHAVVPRRRHRSRHRGRRAFDVIIVPKVKSARDVWFVDDLLTQLERKLGLETGRIGLEVLIEETEALARVEDIAGCSPRLEALILGVGDCPPARESCRPRRHHLRPTASTPATCGTTPATG